MIVDHWQVIIFIVFFFLSFLEHNSIGGFFVFCGCVFVEEL